MSDRSPKRIRTMFGRVAHRYDLANHILSLNLDGGWRQHTVERVREISRNPNARVLDLCCGTGDLTRALAQDRNGTVFGSDFCHPMLTAAQPKLLQLTAPLFEADALQLPLRDSSLDLVTCAFGFRNLASYEGGLAEILRVLHRGGMLAVLEFSHPTQPLFSAAYRNYSKYILPRIGGMISGAPDAYSYLPDSVSKFPHADELARWMERSGFTNVSYQRLTFGIVAIHVGQRAR